MGKKNIQKSRDINIHIISHGSFKSINTDQRSLSSNTGIIGFTTCLIQMARDKRLSSFVNFPVLSNHQTR